MRNIEAAIRIWEKRITGQSDQADRAASEHRDGVAGLDVTVLGGHEARRKHVAEQQLVRTSDRGHAFAARDPVRAETDVLRAGGLERRETYGAQATALKPGLFRTLVSM